MATDEIPVVDFNALNLENKDPFSEVSKEIEDLADQVYQAFSTIGFVYLKNHGIPQEMVSDLGLLRGSRRGLLSRVKIKFVFHKSRIQMNVSTPLQDGNKL